jgi:hypothetical protein
VTDTAAADARHALDATKVGKRERLILQASIPFAVLFGDFGLHKFSLRIAAA